METIATGRGDFRFTDPDEIRAWMRDRKIDPARTIIGRPVKP